MPKTPSKRFGPNPWTDKVVPFVLVFLILILAVVFVIIGLSLVGVFPSA